MSIDYGRTLEYPCPDCGGRMTLRKSRYGPFYGCTDWPKCHGTHGAHRATGRPLGIPASQATRDARVEAYDYFDRLWKDGGPMRRREAYRWMAAALEVDEAHIGEMDASQCGEVVELIEGEFPEVL